MSAIAGTFVKFDAVATRKVARLTIELPIEQADSTLKELGGFPDPANAKWVGIALLDGEPSENTLKGGKLAQTAGIMCNEQAFRDFAEARHHTAEGLIYARCGVMSRAHLDHNEEAARAFRDLKTEYEAWLKVA